MVSYFVYQADLEKDKNEIIGFWNRNHERPLDAKYKWMYEENPAGKAKVWLLKLGETGETVGMTALFPRSFKVDEKKLLAGIMGDFFVHQIHRTLGPALMLQRKVISEAKEGLVDFVYGFPNEKAESIMKRLGCKCLGPLVRLVKILKPAPHLKSNGMPTDLLGAVGPFLNMVIHLISIEAWRQGSRTCVCKEVKHLDKRFDDLWETRRKEFSAVGEREAAYLMWKHLNDPDKENKVLAVFDRSEANVKGLLVYSLYDGFAEIRDLLLPKEKGEMILLMKSFFRLARSLGANSAVLNCLEHNDVMKKMIRLGFIRRHFSRNAYFFSANQALMGSETLKHSSRWFLLRSDEDT